MKFLRKNEEVAVNDYSGPFWVSKPLIPKSYDDDEQKFREFGGVWLDYITFGISDSVSVFYFH